MLVVIWNRNWIFEVRILVCVCWDDDVGRNSAEKIFRSEKLQGSGIQRELRLEESAPFIESKK